MVGIAEIDLGLPEQQHPQRPVEAVAAVAEDFQPGFAHQCGELECLVSDCDPLPLADATATRVVSTEVIEHVDDPRQFLAELVRVG
ncbi:methyltransferase domain-containing protein, partial [Escherichia coli]|uniref:methyltransferase domain-containing protein n=1 Tax=Escherichia coli TaxID=562 RepID=UPI001BFC0163